MNLPEWNNAGIEPPQEFKNNGWTPGVKPPAQYMNWWMNSSYLAIKALQENKASSTELTTLNNKVTTHLDQMASYYSITKNLAQSIPNDIATDVVFNTLSKSTLIQEDFVQLLADGKIKILKAGMYIFSLQYRLSTTSGSGYVTANINSASLSQNIVSGTQQYFKLSSINYLPQDFVMPCNVRQTSGGASNLELANFYIVRLGDSA